MIIFKHISQRIQLPLACLPMLIAITVSWLPYLLVLSHDLSFGDEGVIAQGAYRVFMGETPFKDFFSGLTPGSYYFYAFLFKLFEPTFLVMRLGVMAVSAFLIIAVWLILSKLSARSFSPYMMVALYLAYFGGPVWFVASHHWLSALLCILSLYFLIPVPALHTPSRLNCILAGGFSAAAAVTLQHRGSTWIIAATLAIMLLPADKRIRSIVAYWGGIVLFTIPMALIWVLNAGWDTIYYDLISFPLHQYGKLEGHSGINIHPLELLERYTASWKSISRPGGLLQMTIWTFGLAGMFFVYTAPIFAIFALYHLNRYSSHSRYSLGLLGGALAASYLSTLHRLSDTTLFFASPVAVLIISIALSHAIDSSHQQAKKTSARLLAGLSALFFCIACGYSFQMLSRPSATFQTPAGVVKTIFPQERSTFSTMTTFSSRYIQPGDSVFCYPYNPIHYFIFRYKNPSQYDILTYPMYTQKQMQDVENDLDKKQTRWVVVDSYQKKELSREIPFERYLMQHYIVRTSSPYASIMERRQ